MIIKLNEPLKTIAGNNYLAEDKTPITFKNAAIICCETYKAEKLVPGRTLKIIAIGTKIFNTTGDDLDLNDEEVKLLKEVIESSPIYVAGLIGAMLTKLEA